MLTNYKLALVLALIAVTTTSASHWKDVFLPSSISASVKGVSAQCAKDTATWQNSLKVVAEVSAECLASKKCTPAEKKVIEENFYAVEQLDAWGKLPLTGLFEVPILFDGSYQECERISGKKYETNYCYIILFPGKNATCHMSNGGLPSKIFLRSAVCMPKSCSEQDLPAVFEQLVDEPFTPCAAYCSRFPVQKTSAFWGFSAFMIVMIAVVIVASLFDYIREEVRKSREEESSDLMKDILPVKILLAFSMWTNSELLLSVKEQKPGFIKCLDCIRFLSMLWVVTGHTFTYLMIPDQVLTVTSFFGKFWNHLIMNAFVSVDTFFLLSGIVVAYLFFKNRPEKRQVTSPLTWVLFYVHRYLRLTPPLMIFIGFFVVYGYYIQGPAAASQLNQLIPQVDLCATKWWKNMLYINNLGPDANDCYGITWYLGVDTQLYFVAPIFLISIFFSFTAGTVVIAAAIVGSFITVYILYSANNLPADFFGVGDNTNYYDLIYDKPWIRCPPYLVGLYVGYFLATFGKRKIRLNWALAVTGWIIAFTIAAACLFSTYDYDKRNYWSVFIRATYQNFSRLGWAIAVSWVIVANHLGWGGPINAFMSHPIWQPLGRLSYCAYIVHYFVLYAYLNINDSPIHFYSTFQIFIYYAVPACLLSYIFAFFWSCLFEIPILKLEKMLIEAILGSSRSSRREQPVKDIERVEQVKESTWEIKDSFGENTKF